jgi:hypothetical protein
MQMCRAHLALKTDTDAAFAALRIARVARLIHHLRTGCIAAFRISETKLTFRCLTH